MVFPRKAPGASVKKTAISWLKRWWTISLLGLFILLAAAFFLLMSILDSGLIYPGVTVDGMDVGGMTRQEALSFLRQNMNKTIPRDAILLSTPLQQYRLPFHDIGYMPQYGRALDIAYSKGREGNIFQRLKAIRLLKKQGMQIYPEMCYNVEKTVQILDSIRQDTDKKSKDAQISVKNGNIALEPHQTGLMMDINLSLERINHSLMKRTLEDVNLCVADIMPDVTTQMLDRITSELGEYHTSFSTYNEARTHNIETACSKITQKLLLAGEVFSMDKILGERTEKNGYRHAKVIINNELVDGLGGGICQVTSTFYNAVLLSGLEIVERRNHTLPLSYIDVGRDATISEGYIDFKFKNNLGYALLIEAKIIGGRIITTIWGRLPSPKSTYRIRTNIIEKTEPDGIEMIIDSSLKPGEAVTLREAVPGYKVEVYRDTVDSSGKVIKTEKISVDRYQPQKKKMKVSPRKAEVIDEENPQNTSGENDGVPEQHSMTNDTVETEKQGN